MGDCDDFDFDDDEEEFASPTKPGQIAKSEPWASPNKEEFASPMQTEIATFLFSLPNTKTIWCEISWKGEEYMAAMDCVIKAVYMVWAKHNSDIVKLAFLKEDVGSCVAIKFKAPGFAFKHVLNRAFRLRPDHGSTVGRVKAISEQEHANKIRSADVDNVFTALTNDLAGNSDNLACRVEPSSTGDGNCFPCGQYRRKKLAMKTGYKGVMRPVACIGCGKVEHLLRCFKKHKCAHCHGTIRCLSNRAGRTADTKAIWESIMHNPQQLKQAVLKYKNSRMWPVACICCCLLYTSDAADE